MNKTILIDPDKVKQKHPINHAILIRISENEKKSIDAFCNENGLKRAEFVRNLIKEFFKVNS